MRAARIEAYSETICWWPHGVPAMDLHVVTLARRCETDREPFPMHGKQWVVTYVGPNHGEEDDFVIEGIEKVEGLE